MAKALAQSGNPVQITLSNLQTSGQWVDFGDYTTEIWITTAAQAIQFSVDKVNLFPLAAGAVYTLHIRVKRLWVQAQVNGANVSILAGTEQGSY